MSILGLSGAAGRILLRDLRATFLLLRDESTDHRPHRPLAGPMCRATPEALSSWRSLRRDPTRHCLRLSFAVSAGKFGYSLASADPGLQATCCCPGLPLARERRLVR